MGVCNSNSSTTIKEPERLSINKDKKKDQSYDAEVKQVTPRKQNLEKKQDVEIKQDTEIKQNVVIKESLDVVDKNGDPVDLSKFDMVGLYFSSNDNPDCQEFTTKLVEAYSTWISKDESIEIVFVSNDGDEQSANEQYKKMNFARLVYDEFVIKELNSRLKVDKTPHLEIRTSDLKQTITRKAIAHMNNKKATSIIGWKKLFVDLWSGSKMPSFFSNERLTDFEDNDGEGMTANDVKPWNRTVLDDDDGVIYCYKRLKLEKHASEKSENQININFDTSMMTTPVIVDWINFDGKCEEKFTIKPNEKVDQQSYSGHRWLLRKENGTPFAIYNPNHSIIYSSTVNVMILGYENVCIEVNEPS